MKLSDFNFELPESLLAQYPNENRDESRLLVLNRKNGDIQHFEFKDVIVDFVKENSEMDQSLKTLIAKH